jgi:tungstate transport system ATP-binding protein
MSILPLQISGAVVARKGKRIIGPVDLEVEAGGVTVVMGPNGAGKTTLLRMMHGIERLTAGTVMWQVSEEEARRRQAFVFQTPIMMRRSVVESLAYPLRLVGVAKDDARAQAEGWAERIGLGGALDQRASALSGGERQKLALARALIREPDVLFLDEACANLDGRATREIEEILAAAQANGTRLILSTHDLGQARRLARDVLFVYKGLVHEAGDASAFFANPKTPEAAGFLKGDILE